MSKIGYARCSTVDQNSERQKQILEELGCEKVFIDFFSGKSRNRPELNKMLDYVREGDVLYVESISRLARSVRDLLDIVEELNSKGVDFVSQKEAIDTSSPQGRFVLTIWGAMAELEREQIKQRQTEGIAIAKSKGIYKGKQQKQFDKILFQELYSRYKEGDITSQYMCKKLKVSRTTLWRIMKATEANNSI